MLIITENKSKYVGKKKYICNTKKGSEGKTQEQKKTEEIKIQWKNRDVNSTISLITLNLK